MVQGKLNNHMQKDEFRPFLKENTVNFHDLGLSKDFLDMTPRA